MLFFVAILLAITLLLRDPLLAAMAWAFVSLRILHALVDVTYNAVMHRFLFACSTDGACWLSECRLGWLVVVH